MPERDVVMDRLEDQIRWYGDKSSANQKSYRRMKAAVIISAALIPFVPVFKDYLPAAWITGTLGVMITVIEGMLHLNQNQQNWIAYRSTCESLKHEKFLY